MTPQLTVTMRFGLSIGSAGTSAGTDASPVVRQDAAQAVRDAAQARQDAQQARAEADRIIEEAIQTAERASEGVGEAQPPAEPGSRPIIITQDGGRPVTVDFKNGNVVITQDGTTKSIPWQTVVPSGAVDIAQALAGGLFFLVIGWPIARAIARYIDRRGQINRDTGRLSQQIEERFATMERNLDTVAVEIERLSEAQRFTGKLLAERQTAIPVEVPAGVPVANPRA
jgi:hypothetical protein